MNSLTVLAAASALAVFAAAPFATPAFSHGDVAPQPVNTDTLPDLTEEWALENPYRVNFDDAVYRESIRVGASGYNQNCARCHGLEAIAGGLAPDLRYLEASEYDDEWFLDRFRNGYEQGGVTKMPAFEELLGEKAAWAIRSYVETRPEDGAIDDHADRLFEIRDALRAAEDGDDSVDVAALRDELTEIGDSIPAASGARLADSAASRAAEALAGDEPDLKAAHEAITVGLSVAQ